MNYIFNILVSIDQLINVVFGPLLNLLLRPDYKFGKPDDTLSEVFGRNREKCKTCYIICRALHLLDKNHCEKSID
jgi:hypothetical protein